MNEKLTHFDTAGNAVMVDVTEKQETAREAVAEVPLCHPLPLGKSAVDFHTDEAAGTVTATCTVKVSGQTGVEMEALTGVSVALLTIYDMLKAIDKGMEIGGIRLMKKTGGKSGTFCR